MVDDKRLYPKALAWNRLLLFDLGRFGSDIEEQQKWRDFASETFLGIACEDDGSKCCKEVLESAQRFLGKAADSGVVQVEIPWTTEKIGYAARIFPWERLLAAATKSQREELALAERSRAGLPFVVVRRLTGIKHRTKKGVKLNGTVLAMTEDAASTGFDHLVERKILFGEQSDNTKVVKFDDFSELVDKIGAEVPARLHLVFHYREGDDHQTGTELKKSAWHSIAEKTAKDVAAVGAGFVVLASGDTGKRLAPLVVTKGVPFVIGFHSHVVEASLPAFFSAFYAALDGGSAPLTALQESLHNNKRQPSPDDLGFACLWSSEDMLAAYQGVTARTLSAPASEEQIQSEISEAELEDAIIVTCSIEGSLNYSILHNKGGGIFQKFTVEKRRPGRMRPLMVSVGVTSGLGSPAECRFYVKLDARGDEAVIDLAGRVALPLGSELMRQRGEAVLATVEVSVMCGEVQLLHKMESVKILPCDQWSDSESGRHLLPSFVFPRDPAVRELISTAQPYLRALRDEPHAGFDGYQAGSPRSVMLQCRSIWCAAQHTLKLDYINPPPSYTKESQRLRIPEEILRSGRGTCIELSLLLAACWEHVGIYPVIFLTRGHAFTGYWTDLDSRENFLTDFKGMIDHAIEYEPGSTHQEQMSTGHSAGSRALLRSIKSTPPAPTSKSTNPPPAQLRGMTWMMSQPHHLSAVRTQIASGTLIPLESTYIPLRKPFLEAIRDAASLIDLISPEYFEGMIDIRAARVQDITPMAILHQGVVA